MLDEPFADELTRGQALRFGALLHDVAKPVTRAVTDAGRVTFMGHDREGARVAREVLTRLRASERMRAHVAALARHHLRVGLPRPRAPALAPAGLPLPGGDRPGGGGRDDPLDAPTGSPRAGARPRRRSPGTWSWRRELLGEALERRAAGPLSPLVRGDELATALGIPEGPTLGRLLAELEEARFAGEVGSREEAIAHARELLARSS